MADVTVAILGLGRVGASVGLALARYMAGHKPSHNFTVIGYDSRGYNLKKAKEIGAVGRTERNPYTAAENAHIVVIAAPYHEVEALYELIGPDLKPGAVVLDMSPLKLPSLDWAERFLPQEAEVAAYMVGVTAVINPKVLFNSALDINDPDYAEADLFANGALILSPAANCPAEAVDLAAEFTRIIGATAHFMDPAEHDGLIAATEGLPALLSVALFRMLAGGGTWGDMRRLTNPAFALAIRHVVHQHPDALWGLLHNNRANMVRYLDELIGTLESLRDSLAEDEDGLEIEAAITDTVQQYEAWEKQRFGNQWEKSETATPVPGMLGTLGATLLGGFGRKQDEDDE